MNTPPPPLRLVSRLRRPDTAPDATALATVLLVALMLTLPVSSRFVFAPGITVGVAGPVNLDLPRAAKSEPLPGAATSATVTILALKQDDMAIWNGRIRTLANLEEDLSKLPKSPDQSRGVLLIKADKSVSMQTFFEVVALARRAGFSAVHIAGEEYRPPAAGRSR